MKTRVLAPLSALALLLGSVLAPSAAQDARMEKYEKFQRDFEAAQKINAKAEMARLVKDNQTETIWWIQDTCEKIASGRIEDVYEDRMADLRAAWRAAFDSSFADQMYEYYSLLSGPKRKTWDKLVDEFNKLVDEEWPRAKSGSEYELVGQRFRSLGERFEDVGDKYFAARCWQTYAMCNDESLRKQEANLFAAYQGYKKAVELHDSIDLHDKDYFDCKYRFDVLGKSGYSGEPGPDGQPAPEPGAGPAAGAPEAAVVTAAMSYAAVPDYREYERPSFSMDEMYSAWPYLFFQGIGTSAVFPGWQDGPKLVREGANKISVDTDGDGKGDVPVPLTGRDELVEFDFGQGDERLRWSFVSVIGIAKDRYQEIDVNLEPQLDYMNLYYQPSASVVGSVGEVEVRVFDDNMDGVFGDGPTMWDNIGTVADSYQAEMDCIVVGSGARARPWSRLTQIGEDWYDLSVEARGSRLVAKPATVSTGTLQLEFGGPTPQWLVLRGKDQLEDCYFDIAGKKKVTVPAGSYSLFYGVIRKGKKMDQMKALILPGKTTPTWTVGEGQTTKVSLGKPFGFDFDFKTEGETIKVIGKTVVVVGSAGEHYERIWNARPRPVVSWRKVGSRRGSKGEKMHLISHQDDATEFGWEYFWFPLDLEITVRGGLPEEGVEVQLIDKKNKLFGKIESAWLGS